MNTVLKQTLVASVLSSMFASAAFAAPTETPPDFVKRVADGLITRLKADHAKLQSNPSLVKTIIRQNLDPYVDSQAFTRIVLGTYASNQHTSAAQRAQFEQNFRAVIIENYGGAFAKYTNESYTNTNEFDFIEIALNESNNGISNKVGPRFFGTGYSFGANSNTIPCFKGVYSNYYVFGINVTGEPEPVQNANGGNLSVPCDQMSYP